MRRSLLAAVAAAAFVFAPTSALHAQGKAVELSAGLLAFSSTSCSGCSSVTQIGLGGPVVSVGFYLSPMIAIEPAMSLMYVDSNGSSATQFSIGAGLPIYFDKSWGRKGFYVEPTVRWTSFSCGGCGGQSSQSQVGLGADIGVKAALAPDAALRFQAGYDYGFKTSDIPSTSTINVVIGLSVFLK